MKKFIINNILSVLLSIPIYGLAQQSFLWSRQAGGPGFDRVDGISSSGRNVFVTGGFTESISVSDDEATGTGMRDIFLMRLDENGKPAWIRSFGGRSPDYASCITADEKNIYLAGTVSDSVWSGKTISPGKGQSLFISCWSQSGRLQWLERIDFDGSAIIDILKITSGGNILAGGMFNGSIKLEDQLLENHGGNKAFLLEVSNEGKVIKTILSSGSGNHRLASIDTDEEGNRFLLFHATGSFSFNDIFLQEDGAMKKGGIIILKSDPRGNILWMKRAECSGFSEAVSIVAGQRDAVFLSANFSGELHAGDTVLNTTARLATAVICLGGNGDFRWASASETSEQCRAMEALCTLNGNLLVAGQYSGRFKYGDQEITGNVAGGSIFLFQVMPDGKMAWHDEPAAEGANFSKSVSIDPEGNILLAGAFRGKVKIDGNLMESSGEDDLLIAKYHNCGNLQLDLEMASPLCPGKSGTLRATAGFETYLWNDSKWAGRNFTINIPGKYHVAAFTRMGCVACDTIIVNESLVPEIELGSDTLLSPGEKLALSGPEGFRSYSWNDGAKGPDRIINYRSDSEKEKLILTAGTMEGCFVTDSITISFKSAIVGGDELPEEKLSVYPNPVEDNLWWSLNLHEKEKIRISLVDSKSVALIESEVENYIPDSKGSIDMRGLPAGNYLLTVRTSELTFNEKVVKK